MIRELREKVTRKVVKDRVKCVNVWSGEGDWRKMWRVDGFYDVWVGVG